MRRLLWGTGALAIAAGAALAWLLAPAVQPGFVQAGGAKPAKADVRPVVSVLFLGTSSLVFTDAQTQWMVDGFFSRQPMGQVALKPLQVDGPAVGAVARRAFEALSVPPKLTGIVVAHSHYDHSMDAPALAQAFGGQVAGSSSTGHIAAGQGLPAAQFEDLGQGKVLRWGAFELEAVVSAHAPTGFTGGFNTQPLALPARVWAFKEGVSYAFVVRHASQTGSALAWVQPSAGFVPGQNKGVKADTVFLGVGGLGKLSEDYTRQYWQEVVKPTGAKTVYAIHWDDFMQPLLDNGQPQTLKPMGRWMDDLRVSKPRLEALAQEDSVDLRWLDAWQVVRWP